MIDGDIYGPNVPIMLGLQTQPSTDGQIVPAEQHGIQVVSMGFLTGDDAPVIWRGPMLHGVVQQLFREVRWDRIDYLIVDMPPGTGDVALSLSQTVPVSGAVVVTTPQTVSLADTRRAVRMYQKLNVPMLGLVENMSHFVCPGCQMESDIFEKAEARRSQICRCPLSAESQFTNRFGWAGIQECRSPSANRKPPAARAFRSAAERLAAQLSIASYKRPILLMPV